MGRISSTCGLCLRPQLLRDSAPLVFELTKTTHLLLLRTMRLPQLCGQFVDAAVCLDNLAGEVGGPLLNVGGALLGGILKVTKDVDVQTAQLTHAELEACGQI